MARGSLNVDATTVKRINIFKFTNDFKSIDEVLNYLLEKHEEQSECSGCKKELGKKDGKFIIGSLVLCDYCMDIEE